MKVALHVLRSCGLTAAWLLPLLALCSSAGPLLWPPKVVPQQSDEVAAGPWLHVPLFLLVAALCASTLEAWPAFARARPGAAWLLRYRRGPLRGCGAAALGAAAALATGCALLGLCALAWPGLPSPRAFLRLQGPPGLAVLDRDQRQVAFAGPGEPCEELLLRPIAVLPPGRDAVATELEICIDGQPLGDKPVLIAGDRQLVSVPLHGRALQRVELVAKSGNVLLALPPDAVVAVASAPRSRAANAMLAGLSYLAPGGLALCFALAGAPVLALPVNLALVLGTLLLATLGGLLPTGRALTALLRGRWLPAEGLLPSLLPGLGLAAACVLLGCLLRARSAE
jgi:hypothetical protein